MVSADVALKASMYFWLMMMIGYVAAAQWSFFVHEIDSAARVCHD